MVSIHPPSRSHSRMENTVKYPPTQVGGNLLKPRPSRLFVFLGLWLVTLPTYPRGAQAAHDAEPQTLPTSEVVRANKRLRVTKNILAFLTLLVNKNIGAVFPPLNEFTGCHTEDKR